MRNPLKDVRNIHKLTARRQAGQSRYRMTACPVRLHILHRKQQGLSRESYSCILTHIRIGTAGFLLTVPSRSCAEGRTAYDVWNRWRYSVLNQARLILCLTIYPDRAASFRQKSARHKVSPSYPCVCGSDRVRSQDIRFPITPTEGKGWKTESRIRRSPQNLRQVKKSS